MTQQIASPRWKVPRILSSLDERLGERTVKVCVTAIDDQVLRRCVTGLLWGEKKDRRCGNFRAFRHAMSERDAIGDGLQGGLWIFTAFKPTLV
jgi:hypothetical protein